MLGEKFQSSPIGQNILACLTSQTADSFFIISNKTLEFQYKIILQLRLYQIMVQQWKKVL